MTRKFTILRSENKLKDIDFRVQALFDKKHSAIIKAQEEKAEEIEKTQNDLMSAVAELAMKNAQDIMQIVEQGDLSLLGEEEESEEEEQEREAITKSLQAQGFDIKMLEKGRRLKIQ